MLLPAPPCSGKAELTMKRHISQVVRNRFYHIQQLNQIRRLPGPEDWSNGQAHDIIDFQPTWLLQRCARQSTYLDHITSSVRLECSSMTSCSALSTWSHNFRDVRSSLATSGVSHYLQTLPAHAPYP